MTFKSALTLTAGAALLALAAPAHAKFATGSTVTDMAVVDSNGELHIMSDYAGKTVVLEWTNHGCPYVQKHYDTNNMQNLQKSAADDDVVWLSIVSSAPGTQGFVSGDEANVLTASRDAAPSAVLLDPAGSVGRTFEAKTTPHMYIIDADQTLVYQGAIDDNRSARTRSVEGAHNYVTAALDAMKAGEPIAVAETTPYGCNVKYK